MDTAEAIQSIPDIPLHTHVCSIYDDPIRQLHFIAEFLKVGLARNEKCIYVANENEVSTVQRVLEEHGIDFHNGVASGALRLSTPHETYLQQGHFDIDGTFELWEGQYRLALAEGYSAMRLTGETPWILKDSLTTDNVLQYESRATEFMSTRRITAICQYNRTLFPPKRIREVLFTHPQVMFDGIACPNHYFIPPKEYLHPNQAEVEVSRLLDHIFTRQKHALELQKANQQLKRSQDSFRVLTETIPQMVWAADANGKLDYANQRLLSYIGLAPSENIDEKWTHILHPEDAFRSIQGWQESVSTGVPYSIENRLRRFDGTFRWHLTRSLPLKNEDGKIVRWFGTSTDIEEQKNISNELQQRSHQLARSNEELERFAYVASHDLKEPLRTMSNHVQALSRKSAGKLPVEAQESMAYIVEASKRLYALIDDLLTYSGAGREDQPLVYTDLNLILRKVLSDLDESIRESGAVLSISPLPSLMVEPGQVTQLFQNLVSNAIKYRGKPMPKISVSFEEGNGEYIFAVSDDGIGIEPRFHERIFVIFQRLHGRGQYSGTGIGLAICKRIVFRHGGNIWVESRLGEGATFRFTIPFEGVSRK